MIGRPLPQFWSQQPPGERAFPFAQPCSPRLTCSPLTTSTPRTARTCAGSSISKLGEASQTTLHGIHAQAPPAAAVQRALSPPRALRVARSRSASALRPTPESALGVSRSTLTGSLSMAAAMVGVKLKSSAAAAAAAANAAPQAALTAARRRRSEQWYAAARGGATTVERAEGRRETAGAAAEKAGECVAAVQVQCARVRACLLM